MLPRRESAARAPLRVPQGPPPKPLLVENKTSPLHNNRPPAPPRHRHPHPPVSGHTGSPPPSPAPRMTAGAARARALTPLAAAGGGAHLSVRAGLELRRTSPDGAARPLVLCPSVLRRDPPGRAAQFYEELLEKFPGSTSLHCDYAHFCYVVLNDEVRAESLRERAALLETAAGAARACGMRALSRQRPCAAGPAFSSTARRPASTGPPPSPLPPSLSLAPKAQNRRTTQGVCGTYRSHGGGEGGGGGSDGDRQRQRRRRRRQVAWLKAFVGMIPVHVITLQARLPRPLSAQRPTGMLGPLQHGLGRPGPVQPAAMRALGARPPSPAVFAPTSEEGALACCGPRCRRQ